jgi:hypothetical protein
LREITPGGAFDRVALPFTRPCRDTSHNSLTSMGNWLLAVYLCTEIHLRAGGALTCVGSAVLAHRPVRLHSGDGSKWFSTGSHGLFMSGGAEGFALIPAHIHDSVRFNCVVWLPSKPTRRD